MDSDRDDGQDEIDPYANLHLQHMRPRTGVIGHHVATFEDSNKDQWVFTRLSGHPHGVVASSTAFWANRRARLTPRAQRTEPAKYPGGGLIVRDEHAPTISLPEDVSSWLATCWWASNTEAQRRDDIDVIAADIAEQIRAEAVRTSMEFLVAGGPALISRACMLIGEAAGRRGMHSGWTATLYQVLIPDLFPSLNADMAALRPRD